MPAAAGPHAHLDLVRAKLVVLAGDDARHAVVAEQQLGALAALVLSATEGGDGEAGGRG